MSLAAAGDSLLLGRGLCELGMLAELEGDYGRATTCYESALDVSKELPEAKSDVILRHLAEVAIPGRISPTLRNCSSAASCWTASRAGSWASHGA